jgi:hypothetical protein
MEELMLGILMCVVLAALIPGQWDDAPLTQECRHHIAIAHCTQCNT